MRGRLPGGIPGRPITPARLADRLRAIGIPTRAGRRAAHLADLLGFHPNTAVKWMNQAGADWSRYAADIA